jgi:hypothetical protein
MPDIVRTCAKWRTPSYTSEQRRNHRQPTSAAFIAAPNCLSRTASSLQADQPFQELFLLIELRTPFQTVVSLGGGTSRMGARPGMEGSSKGSSTFGVLGTASKSTKVIVVKATPIAKARSNLPIVIAPPDPARARRRFGRT